MAVPVFDSRESDSKNPEESGNEKIEAQEMESDEEVVTGDEYMEITTDDEVDIGSETGTLGEETEMEEDVTPDDSTDGE